MGLFSRKAGCSTVTSKSLSALCSGVSLHDNSVVATVKECQYLLLSCFHNMDHFRLCHGDNEIYKIKPAFP
jgi:hypothetical protein